MGMKRPLWALLVRVYWNAMYKTLSICQDLLIIQTVIAHRHHQGNPELDLWKETERGSVSIEEKHECCV